MTDVNKNKFFVTKGRYGVFTEWFYAGPENSFENCRVFPADEEAEELDGTNQVSRCGDEGLQLYIYDTLEEAIFKSGFKVTSWKKINIYDLSEEDKIIAKNFIEFAQTHYAEIEKEYKSLNS